MIKTLKAIRKIAVIGVVGLLTFGALAGCTVKEPKVYSESELKNIVSDAKLAATETGRQAGYRTGMVDGAASVDVDKAIDGALAEVDLTVDNEEATEDALKEVLTEYGFELEENDVALEILKDVLEITKEEKVTNAAIEEGKLIDELNLNSFVSTYTLTDNDIKSFIDTKIEFDEDNYDVHEEVVINTNSVAVRTSLYDEEFSDNIYLTLEDTNSIVYKYVFDDKVLFSKITTDEPLEIDFLGQTIKIVGASSNQIIVREGEEKFIKEGDNFTVGEDVITLVSVGDDYAYIDVNGERKKIYEGDTKQLGDVDILVDEVINNDESDQDDFATLIVGKDVEKTIDEGDEWVDDDQFELEIVEDGLNLASLNIKYVELRKDLDDDFLPLSIGDTLNFPNDYFGIKFNDITEVAYNKYTFDFRDFDSSDLNIQSLDTIRIESDDKEGFKIGTDEVDKVYINKSKAFYRDSDGDDQMVDLSSLEFNWGDIKATLSFSGDTLTIDSDDKDINLAINSSLTFLGTIEDDSESVEIEYDSDFFGTQEEDVVTEYGLVIKNPEGNGNKDKFVVEFPDEKVEASILVG